MPQKALSKLPLCLKKLDQTSRIGAELVQAVRWEPPYRRRTEGIFATALSNSHQTWLPASRSEDVLKSGQLTMTIKTIVVPLEVEYLEQVAKDRGVSRTKLVRVVMQKVVRDKLVSKILGDDDPANAEPPPRRYRRFRNRARGVAA